MRPPLVKIVQSKTGGLVSVQVWTDRLPGRPFPAYAVLVDITKDGKMFKYPGDEKHRKEVIASYKRTRKVRS